MDRSDAIAVTERPLTDHEPARKTVYEPRSDGTWLKITKRWVGGVWHQEGQVIVADVEVEHD